MTNLDITPEGIKAALALLQRMAYEINRDILFDGEDESVEARAWLKKINDTCNALLPTDARMAELEAGARDNSEWVRQAIADKEAAEKRVAELEAALEVRTQEMQHFMKMLDVECQKIERLLLLTAGEYAGDYQVLDEYRNFCAKIDAKEGR